MIMAIQKLMNSHNLIFRKFQRNLDYKIILKYFFSSFNNPKIIKLTRKYPVSLKIWDGSDPIISYIAFNKKIVSNVEIIKNITSTIWRITTPLNMITGFPTLIKILNLITKCLNQPKKLL